VHIGTDDTYIALNEAWKDNAEQWVPKPGRTMPSNGSHTTGKPV
jgi:hypothetical protein